MIHLAHNPHRIRDGASGSLPNRSNRTLLARASFCDGPCGESCGIVSRTRMMVSQGAFRIVSLPRVPSRAVKKFQRVPLTQMCFNVTCPKGLVRACSAWENPCSTACSQEKIFTAPGLRPPLASKRGLKTFTKWHDPTPTLWFCTCASRLLYIYYIIYFI